MTAWLRRTSSGRAVGDLAAVVEHDHVVGQIHHHADVVLDEHHRRAELAVGVDG